MLDKARKMPPPKDKLEPLIEYALCVSNIYMGYGYIEEFTAACLISYGDILFRVPQPHSIFHQLKTQNSSYPYSSKRSISITLFH